MALNEEYQLQAHIQNEPKDLNAFQKLIQLHIRKGELTQAFSTALDHFFVFPNQESCYQLYSCRRELYLSKEQELPKSDSDRVVLYPISFTYGILVLLGGRMGKKVTEVQEILEPFVNFPKVLILDFLNTRFVDSTALGYLSQWLENRKNQNLKTYCVDMNERVKICFKHLDLYHLIEAPDKKNPELPLPHCLLKIREDECSQASNIENLNITTYKLVPVYPEYNLFEKIWSCLTLQPENPPEYKIREV